MYCVKILCVFNRQKDEHTTSGILLTISSELPTTC